MIDPEDEFAYMKQFLVQDNPEMTYVELKLTEIATELGHLHTFAIENELWEPNDDRFEAAYEAQLHLSRLLDGLETDEVPAAEKYWA